MNHRRERFATFVAGGMAPKDAYVAAGYTGNDAVKCASEILSNPDVRELVGELQNKEAKDKGLGPEWVIKQAAFIYEKAITPVVITDRRGEIIGEKCAELPTALATVKMVSGFNGMTTERHRVEMSDEVQQILDRVVAAVVAEVEDPSIRERIIARLTGEGVVAAEH